MESHLRFRPIHPFPARMAPSIALDELPQASGRPLRVLDPMAGSGTTLVAARSRGHTAYGFDTDPLALLIADTWCADVDASETFCVAEDVLDKARRRYARITQGTAYPRGADEETRAFVRYWFDPTNRRQLKALSDAISSVHDTTVRHILWCGFSRLIIAKARGASWAMDLSHSRPHRVTSKPPFRPLPNFLAAVDTVLKRSPFPRAAQTSPTAHVRSGDARSVPLPDDSVDIVITSPPYLNAIDYVRCNKFSLIWMGHQIPALRVLRTTNIGTEASMGVNHEDPEIAPVMKVMGEVHALPPSNQRMLGRYIADMNAVMREISRVLVQSGRCVLVVGDCTMRGLFIRNSAALIELGRRYGLMTDTVKARPLPANRRYLPPPCSRDAGQHLQGRMREEIVITMQAA